MLTPEERNLRYAVASAAAELERIGAGGGSPQGNQ